MFRKNGVIIASILNYFINYHTEYVKISVFYLKQISQKKNHPAWGSDRLEFFAHKAQVHYYYVRGMGIYVTLFFISGTIQISHLY